MDWVPEIVLLPDHDPLPVHAVASVLDQVSVDEAPDAILVGDALSVTVGTGAVTVTVADPFPEPPVPVHVSVYVESAVSGPVV